MRYAKTLPIDTELTFNSLIRTSAVVRQNAELLFHG